MTDRFDTQAIDVGLAIIVREDDLLICRRPAGVPLAGYWEFPGGKRQLGETIEQCVVREVREELGIEIAITGRLDSIDHVYSHGAVRLHPFVCRIQAGEPAARQASEVRWVSNRLLDNYRFPPANDAILSQIRTINEV